MTSKKAIKIKPMYDMLAMHILKSIDNLCRVEDGFDRRKFAISILFDETKQVTIGTICQAKVLCYLIFYEILTLSEILFKKIKLHRFS